jgi:hypothetical protein
MVMRLMGLGLVVVAGCRPCSIGTQATEVYGATEVKLGDVTAPPTWQVGTKMDEESGWSCPGGVPEVTRCTESGTCQTACFGVTTVAGPKPGYARLVFDFIVSGLPWHEGVVLPDSRVEVYPALHTDDATVSAGPIELVGGTLDVLYVKNNFEARFVLDAEAAEGHVTVSNGRFALLQGHYHTECY